MLPSATDLTYFYEIALDLNVSRTARKLNVSQPSLSLCIKRLEKLLGVHLFVRHAQGLTLTGAGLELFNNVQKLVSLWHEIAGNIKKTTDFIQGMVTIGCHSTLSPFMSNMVSQLLTEHPALEIHFQHGFAQEIMQNIVDGTLDIGITTDPYPHASVIIFPIAETEFTFWMSKGQKTIDLQAKDLLVICDPQIQPTQYLLNELQKIRCSHTSPRLSTINQIEAIAAMTTESTGVGILPTAFTEYYFSNQLQKIPDAPVYTKPLCIAYRPEKKGVIAVETVIKAIRSLVNAV